MVSPSFSSTVLVPSVLLLVFVFFIFFTVKGLTYLEFMLVCDIWN